MKNETISAFAYNTGKMIEELIDRETNNIRQQNVTLQAKIMDWWVKSKDEKFKEHFGIISDKDINDYLSRNL